LKTTTAGKGPTIGGARIGRRASSSASAAPGGYDWPALLRACAGRALTGHLAATPLPARALIAAAAPPRRGEPYGRSPIFRDVTGEVLLVRWREDTFCAPHDHGDAGGFVLLLRGRLVERLWRWRDGDLVPALEREYVAPTVINVRRGAIHDMKAAGAGVGIHFYLPAIRQMKAFDRVGRQTLIVGDDCGAWVPRDAALIESRVAW
jgi:hypothetical protein